MGHKGHYGQYSGNHPRFSKRQDEAYDAKMAYDKDLTGKARLHYLENDIADKKSPANSHCSPMHNDRAKRLRERAIKISERSGAERGDEYDYENPRVTELLEKAKKIDERSNKKAFIKGAKDFMKKAPKVFDERSGEERRKDIDEMIYERPDINRESSEKMGMKGYSSKIDSNHTNFVGDYSFDDAFKQARKMFGSKGTFTHKGKNYNTQYAEEKKLNDLPRFGVEKTIKKKTDINRYSSSPANACAKSEGGSGCIKQMGGAWRVISNKTDKPWPAKYASKAKAEAALRGYHAG